MSLIAEEIIKYLDRKIWVLTGKPDTIPTPYLGHDKKMLIRMLSMMIMIDLQKYCRNTRCIGMVKDIKMGYSSERRINYSVEVTLGLVEKSDDYKVNGECDRISYRLEEIMSDGLDYRIEVKCPFFITYYALCHSSIVYDKY